MYEEEELTRTFKALSHPVRRQILDLVKDGPKTTGELSDQFEDLSRYAVMKHLRQLEESNLIIVRREGRNRENYLNAVPLKEIHNRWMNQYQSTMAGSMLALKNNIERGNNDMEKPHNLKHDAFQIEQKITIDAPVSKVFDSLTKDIDKWWAYRLCGEDSTLYLDPKLGGQFVEKASEDHAALWGTVTYVNAPYELRFQGLLGMNTAVNGAYSYSLEEKDSKTILTLSHDVSGLIDPEWKENYSGGWEELLGKFLKEYVEEGKIPENVRG
ncbi:helix-turn-helix domain-containing protein [Halobacillus yeomjeoni]|uniref:helix-turn-helix domain-containing protein n=1 Tax=Halobacillus yeomjeoni TaxID=311194 RepID=UPI001CD27116|nr:helix-turn-helix domain-containing protein [Halobacillus yeomjeoni]MCA0984581.1 helix-turn-helix domain-containing protein [Halobacillus yeomjeoni]